MVLDSINGSEIVFNFAGLADIDIAQSNALATVKYNILGIQ